MSETLRITILILGLSFVAVVFYLLVSRRINERASLPWILGSVIIIVLSVIPNVLEKLAAVAGVSYPPALLFVVANLLIILLLLYQAIQISVLQDKCREQAQHLSIFMSAGYRFPINQAEIEIQHDTNLTSAKQTYRLMN